MGYARFLKNLRNGRKKKLVLVAVVILIILFVVGALIFAIINALLGQADVGIGNSISGFFAMLWNAAADFIQTSWEQITANPLQSLNGSDN